MIIFLTDDALADYDSLPENLKKLVKKQLDFSLQDLRYPSLQAKRYHCRIPSLWQARVNHRYRFYFHINGDAYFIIAITDHPK